MENTENTVEKWVNLDDLFFGLPASYESLDCMNREVRAITTYNLHARRIGFFDTQIFLKILLGVSDELTGVPIELLSFIKACVGPDYPISITSDNSIYFNMRPI